MANFLTDNPYDPRTLWSDDQKVVNALADLKAAVNAHTAASFVTVSAEAGLPNSRQLAAGANITLDTATAGLIKVVGAPGNGSITSAMLAAGAAATNVGTLGGSLSGTLPNPGIAAGAVGTTELAATSVTQAKIANNAVDLAQLADTGWTNATLTGATNVGAPYPSTRYRRIAGIVWLEIAFNRSVADGSTIFTLPAGYRPAGTVVMHTGVTDNIQRLTVDSSGNVVTNHQVSNPLIATFCFPAEQ